MPQHAAKIKPPRTLEVPFELGRPMGVPDDPEFQHRVLSAALELLEQCEGQVVSTYEEEAPSANDSSGEVWACPVSFSSSEDDTSLKQAVLSEISLLQPWYDKGKENRGSTSFGVSEMPLIDIVGYLAGFLNDDSHQVSPASRYSIADCLKYGAEDLKAFYNESATCQPGNVSATEVENWYWGETRAGQLVREIKKACIDHDDPMVKIVAGFTLVPHTQAFRDS